MEANQWQELCEWAGFYISRHSGDALSSPCDMWCHDDYYGHNLPKQDMNTLFRWMVPKLLSKGHAAELTMFDCTGGPTVNSVRIDGWYYGGSEDPFEALAQAIYQVVKK